MATGYNKSLLNYLLNRRDFVPGTELSAVLGVSTKTVSRIVKHVNEQSTNGMIIESQRGRGYPSTPPITSPSETSTRKPASPVC